MEYANVIAAVPAGESFDASAVNEGVWLSVAHLDNVEAALAGNASYVAESQATIAALTATGAELVTSNSAAAQTIAERDATIAAQAAEIATLKAAPAGNMQQTSKEKDDLGNDQVQESETTREARKLREMRDGKK